MKFSNVMSVYTIVEEDEGGMEWDTYAATDSPSINLSTVRAEYLDEYDEYFIFTAEHDAEGGSLYFFNVTDEDEDAYNIIIKVPVGEAEEESDTLDIAKNDCTVIGSYMRGDVLYYDKTVPAAAKNVRFVDFEPESVMYLSGLVGGSLEETNTAPLSGAYKVPATFDSDSWDPAEDFEDFDFSDKYLYWVYDEEGVSTSFVIDIPAAEEQPEITLTASAEGEELSVIVTEDAYEYYDYMGGGDSTADLYTVVIPPYAIDEVTLDFGENTYITYGYDSEGTYKASYGSLSGQSSVDIPDLDYYIWVQTPYSADWSSGGELQYVVNFKPMFVASINGTDTVLTDITCEKDGYKYTDYYGTSYLGNLYTVTIPYGTEKIDFAFSDNCLAYNYKGTGAHPVTIDGTDDTAFLGGAVDDFVNGSDNYTRDVDINGDKITDYIQVQNTYNAVDWSGAELRYAVTFRYIFSASVDGEAMTDVTVTEDGYTPYVYDSETGSMVPGTPVKLYTVAIPEGTAEVDLSFPENILAYNYKDGETWISGEYSGEELSAGVDAATVPVDGNDDGVVDYVQIQTPFDENYNSTVLYAITFDCSTSAVEPDDVTAEQVRDNIAAKYAESGVAADANAPWLAADMAAYEASFPDSESKLTDAQKQDMVDKAIADIVSASSPSDVAKNIIALAAMKYDPRQLTTAEGETLDAVARLDELTFGEDGALTAAAGNIYAMPYIMIAYQQFNDCQDQLDKLKTAAIEKKSDWLSTAWGTDGLTPMMLALAPYNSESDVQTALGEAAAALKEAQAEDGSLGNAASTGLAMAGLAAVSENPADVTAGEGGKSLVDGILTFVGEDQASFKPVNSSFATEQGFRGLIALANVGSEPYRIYDFSGSIDERVPAAATPVKAGVDFSVVPSTASVTVLSEDGAVVAPSSANDKAYNLDVGSYTYKVEKEGYVTASNTFTITEDDISSGVRNTIKVTLEPKSSGGSDVVTVTVKILVHDADTCGNALTYKNNPDKYFSLLGDVESDMVTLKAKDATAEDALLATLNKYDIDYVQKGNGYFPSIGGYEEMAHGSNSGWLYMVNGKAATTAADGYKITKDSVMIWFYTDDYTKDYGGESFSGGGGGSSSTAPVDITPAENGTVTVSPAKATAGVDVTVTPKPADGYETDKVTGTDKNGKEVPVTANDDGTYSFVMPEGGATVTASFKEKAPDNPPGHDNCPAAPFKDVDTTQWYHESIDYAIENGLMNGVASDRFDPQGTTTRAMIVTILYRLEGEPEVDGENAFDDVEDGQWYTDAIIWANVNEIVNGYGEGKFGPNDDITREQFVTILYRYAQLKGTAVSPDANILDFDDALDVSEWAVEAVRWAVQEKIMQGDNNNNLLPGDNATRAQAATLFMRFAEGVKQ
ncbi:MAG: S-layer homology domain-containing protein [Oscillospiraceae bacterium]|nr:S-layer homology domain-containing protein [Oscillospiraceae bacterium]